MQATNIQREGVESNRDLTGRDHGDTRDVDDLVADDFGGPWRSLRPVHSLFFDQLTLRGCKAFRDTRRDDLHLVCARPHC